MINIDFINIDNAKMVSRLLPFWARGRRISAFLQGILAPLQTAHRDFKAWALGKYIECHITAQKDSLEWYLKYRLSQHFANPEDTFRIVHGVNENICCFSSKKWYGHLHWSNTLRWGIDKTEYDSSYIETIGRTNVYAPAITEDPSYTSEDYERDIRNILQKYMINFNKIYIYIS